MPTATDSPPRFEPPGPGAWSLDTAHFPRPATRFVTELFCEPAKRGFQEATGRYGLLLDHIEWAFVHRWAYLCPRPVTALGEAGDTLTRQEWDALLRSSPALGARVAASDQVFAVRPWREDVRLWDEVTKPGMRRDHLALQAAASRSRDPRELADYLHRCRENLRRSIYHHHRLNVAPVIPAGDFMVHAAEWTGRPTGELVALVREAGPVSLGAARELSRLAAALDGDPAGVAVLDSGDQPTAVLTALVARPAPVGPAAADYLDLVSHWSVGSGNDVGEPCLGEMPGLLVETIRTAVDDGGAQASAPATADRVAALRSGVPQRHKATFDELLAEAHASHRVRDERATYCDVWAFGLARRAVLAAGTYLTDAGIIDRPELLVEAGYQEIRSFLESGQGPSGEELAARASYREGFPESQVPTVLGGPHRTPIPPEWLPPGAARTERAFRAYVGAMSGEPDASEEGAALRGVAASVGTYAGPARVVRTADELGGVVQGEVLVTSSMTPAFNAVLSLVGAIVTDRGGLLSHAAIVAREYGIPAVVGTGDATVRIPDGATVLVDGAAGVVDIRG